MKIGVFDSGLGGLTVLRELKRSVPEASFIYLGDTARTPYGSKSATTIVRYSLECEAFLASHDIDLLVVACNTASSMALNEISAQSACPVIGTIEPAVQTCLHAQPNKNVAVLGTRATVGSGVYERRLRELRPDLKVTSIACPLFVPLVEEGLVEGAIAEEVVRHYLSPLKINKTEVVILACTHYPLLAPLISRYLGSEVKIVECAAAIANVVQNKFSGRNLPQENLRDHFFVTDEAGRFNSLARLLIPEVQVEAAHLELSP